MYKDKLDNLLERGVLSRDEYDKFFESMYEDNNGQMLGVVPSEKFRYKYNFDGNLLDGSLVDFILNEITVPLEAEEIDPIFKIYGYSYYGICDGYKWFTKAEITKMQMDQGYKPIENASELELWKIIGICSRYWEVQYKEWYEHK